MELFTTSLKQPEPIVIPEWRGDVQSESHISGYCEFCWGWDHLSNLIVAHDPERTNGHSLAHPSCVDPSWELCTC